MENEPPQEFLDYVKAIAVAERENQVAKATISVGPFTAFCMISTLQLANRHPALNGSMRTQIRSVVDQLKPLFVGTPAEELINRGDHPEWDVSQSTPRIYDDNLPQGSVYVRWQRDQPRRANTFTVTERPVWCYLCSEPVEIGQELVLYAFGPDEPEDAVRHDAGDWYTAVAGTYHKACLDEQDPPVVMCPNGCGWSVANCGCGRDKLTPAQRVVADQAVRYARALLADPMVTHAQRQGAEQVIRNHGIYPTGELVTATDNPMIFDRPGGGFVALMCEECSTLGGHSENCSLAGGKDTSG